MEEFKSEPPKNPMDAAEAERVAWALKPGVDLGIALQKEKTGEKSAIKMGNISGMNVVLEACPHAFEEITDGDQRVLVIKEPFGRDDNSIYCLTENGIFGVEAIARNDSSEVPTKYKVSSKAINFIEVANLMGEKPSDQERASRGVVVEKQDGHIIDENLAHGVRARISRIMLVKDNDNVPGVLYDRFRQYIQDVEDVHRDDAIKITARETAEAYSISGLANLFTKSAN